MEYQVEVQVPHIFLNKCVLKADSITKVELFM